MKLFVTMLLGLVGAIIGSPRHAIFVGRMRTGDVAFTGRMGAGFPGDINRTHPVSIEPCLIDEDDPAEGYGRPVLVDAATQGVRQFTAADDTADDEPVRPWGFTVRPYPQQVDTATNYGAESLGAAIPPAAGIIDVMKQGYIMAKANAGSAPVKGGQVYVWCAATAGDHIQGQLESAFDAGNTATLDNCFFNGPADANDVVEVVLRG